MNNINNQKSQFRTKLLIKLKILEIFPLKEDIKDILCEYSLKFDETNNNIYNIYNIIYMLNNTIILIPTKNQNSTQIKVNLIKDHNKIISKSILNINENSDEYTVKFNFMNKYINIKFHYNLNVINLNEENKIKRREIDYKLNFINEPKNRNSRNIHSNEAINYKFIKNPSNIKNNDSNRKGMGKKKNSEYLYNSDSKNNSHFKLNKSPIIFPCNLIFNNKETFDNKNNYSEIWINETKMFIKNIKNYITLRNSRNNSKKEIKKCFSAKKINSCTGDYNKYKNSLSGRKKISKDNVTNSSNSSMDIQKNENRFSINEISMVNKYRSAKQINNSANNIKEESYSKIKKYNNSTASFENKNKIINNNIKKDVQNNLLNNYIENVKIENNNDNDEENSKYKINNNQINNNLYTKKRIKKINEIKNNLFNIKDINISINHKRNQSSDNIIIKYNKSDEVYNKNQTNSFQYLNQIEENEENTINSFIIFYQMKNDLYLLYNKKYISNIRDELLKFELELLVEKISELVQEYHKNMKDEKIIYKYLLNTYKKYKKLFQMYKSMKRKLNQIKAINEEKADKLKINTKDMLIFNNEVSLFNLIFQNYINEKEKNENYEGKNSKIISKMLKDILIIILNKKYNKDLILNEEHKNWIENNK